VSYGDERDLIIELVNIYEFKKIPLLSHHPFVHRPQKKLIPEHFPEIQRDGSQLTCHVDRKCTGAIAY